MEHIKKILEDVLLQILQQTIKDNGFDYDVVEIIDNNHIKVLDKGRERVIDIDQILTKEG